MLDVVTVPGSSFRWILMAAKILELDLETLLLNVGLEPALAFSQDEQIPYEKVAKIREVVRSHFPYDSFALEVGQRIPIGELGVVDYVCIQSTSLADAMENLSRYFQLVAHPNLGLTFHVKEDGGYLETASNYHVHDKVGWFEQQSVEFTFSVILHRIRYATGLNMFPKHIYLRYPKPDDIEVYEHIFGQSITFNSEKNIMILSNEALALSPVKADFRLYKLLRGYVDEAIEKIPDATDIEGRVLQVLKAKLQSGDTAIKSIAPMLCMSPRTLHRKLQDAGTSYNALREKLRFELAKTYLHDYAMNISDISYLLGFSQVSAFHRAFKRWANVTPQDYRESFLASGKTIRSRDSK